MDEPQKHYAKERGQTQKTMYYIIPFRWNGHRGKTTETGK